MSTRYSVEEIDEMRVLVRSLIEERRSGPYLDLDYPNGGWQRQGHTAAVEEVEAELRTYMMNDITIDDLRGALTNTVARGERVRIKLEDLQR